MNEFRYRLQTEGIDYAIQMERDGQTRALQVVDHSFFQTLRDAIVAFLKRDVRELEKQVVTSGNYYVKNIGIWDTDTGLLAVEVRTIPMESSPTGEPVPGIYLWFTEGMQPIMEKAGLSPDVFAGRYLESRGMLLATYGYNQEGYILNINPEVQHLISRLEDCQALQPAWQYRLQIREFEHGNPPSNNPYRAITFQYHYSEMHRAFSELLLINPTQLDPFMALSINGESHYIGKAELFNREGSDLARLSVVKSNQYPEQSDPGIHLQLGIDASQFGQQSGIDLSPLLKEGKNACMLYRYSHDGESFVPLKPFVQVLCNSFHPGHEPALPPEEARFAVRLEWQDLNPYTGRPYNEKIANLTQFLFSDLESAVHSLLSLDNDLFDSIHQKEYAFFIPQASLIDLKDEQEVMCKFKVERSGENISNDPYVRLHRDRLNPETILAIQKILQHVRPGGLPVSFVWPVRNTPEKAYPVKRMQHTKGRSHGPKYNP